MLLVNIGYLFLLCEKYITSGACVVSGKTLLRIEGHE